jgi:hypothetical protein
MHKIKGKFWAILVQWNDGSMFAEDVEIPVTQSFRKILCDTKRHAQMVASMDKVVPKTKGKVRIVAVTVEMREVSKSRASRVKGKKR